MAWIRSLTGVVLLTIVASSVRAAPPSFENHGDHGHHPYHLVEAANYKNLALPMPELHHGLDQPQFQEVAIESRKIFRPHYFLYPYILSHPNHPLNNPYPELAESPGTEEADDETPITEGDAKDAQTDDNEEMPETIEVPQAYENELEAKIDEEEIEVADREQEDVLTVVNDECAGTSAVEELPPNGFYPGFLANHFGFHGFNNPHFSGVAAEPDIVDTPEIETDQIDTNDGSGDDEITVYAQPERRKATDEGNDEKELDGKFVLEFRDTIKVECDFLTQPRFSCYSCYDYLECKEKEGKVKSCNNPLAPYCVNGICSPTPSSECA